MSDWSEQYQQDIIVFFTNDYGSTCENNDPQDQSCTQEQSLSLSNRSITPTSTISEDEVKNYSQQLRDTHVTVNLFDCMECYVSTPRCEVGLQRHGFFVTEIPTEIDLQIQELPKTEEEKTVSQSQPNAATSQEEDEEQDEFYGEGLDVEDFDPWKHFIYSP